MFGGLVFVGFEMAIGGEHDKIEVIFVGHGFAPFAPAKVNELWIMSESLF